MRGRLILGTTLGLLAAGSAHAQSSQPSSQPSNTIGSNLLGAKATGAIEVGGTQAVVCGVNFDRASAAVNLIETASQSVGISLQCNTRFTLTARSANGALRNETGYVAGDPLTYVPYQVQWPVEMRDANGALIAPGFNASGQNWSGGLVAASAPTRQPQSGQMTVQWGTGINVLAGTYVDTFYLDIVAN